MQTFVKTQGSGRAQDTFLRVVPMVSSREESSFRQIKKCQIGINVKTGNVPQITTNSPICNNNYRFFIFLCATALALS